MTGDSRSVMGSYYMPLRHSLYAGMLTTVGIGLFLLRLWQPENQVRKHTTHLLDAIGQKDWPKFGAFIADDYQDGWGNDRALVIERTREIFRQLHDVRISALGSAVLVEESKATWRANIQIDGDDRSELMAELKGRVNAIKTPFELEWRHRSNKPWDWRLVSVRNPELTVSEY